MNPKTNPYSTPCPTYNISNLSNFQAKLSLYNNDLTTKGYSDTFYVANPAYPYQAINIIGFNTLTNDLTQSKEVIHTLFHETTNKIRHHQFEQTAINRGVSASHIWELKNYGHTNTNTISTPDWNKQYSGVFGNTQIPSENKAIFQTGNYFNDSSTQNDRIGLGNRDERKLSFWEEMKIGSLSPVFAKENNISIPEAKDLLTTAGRAMVDKKASRGLKPISIVGCSDKVCQQEQAYLNNGKIYDQKDFENAKSFLLGQTAGELFKYLEYEKKYPYFIPTAFDYYQPNLELGQHAAEKSSMIPFYQIYPGKLMVQSIKETILMEMDE